MKPRRSFVVLVVVLLLLALPVSTGLAQTAADQSVTDLQGTIQGAHYVIRVPAAWNGTLLLYAHGYSMAHVTKPEAAFLSNLGMEETLLAKGYALAASGYRDSGWNVEEGMADTQALLAFFRETVGDPDRVILYGVSMGGVVALKSIEITRGLYDGIIPICASSGGTTAAFDRKLDYAVAYDAVFGWPESWGSIGDVDDKIDFFKDVFPKVQMELFGPDGYANVPQWEFIRRVTGTPEGGFYTYEGPVDMPVGAVAMVYFMTEQRAELETRAGGPIAQNVNRLYSLSKADERDLRDLGVDVEGYLATMNAMTDFEADPEARAYVANYADFDGTISVPVLLTHNVEDSISPVENTLVYQETVDGAGNSAWLVRAYSALPGHCNLTPDQLMALIDAMNGWLDTGRRPTPAAFPKTLDFAKLN